MGDRPGFCFFVCPDSLLLKRRLENQTGELLSSDVSRHTHWGDEEPSEAFWDQLTLQGMFGKSRAVVVRQAQQWPAAVWKRLSKILSRPSPLCLPFFCLENPFEKGKPKIPAHIAKLPCFVFADKNGWIWRQSGLNERDIKRYVQVRAGELGIRFQTDALEQFCACLLPDALTIENELSKLVLLSQAGSSKKTGEIDAAMMAVCATGAECNIFALLRHIEGGNLPAALRETARNREGDSLLFPLLSLLARDLRMIWRLKAGEQAPPYFQDGDMKKRLAQLMGFSELSRCIALVMDAELMVKSGRCETEQSLDFLILEMTRAFRAALP